MFAAIKTPDTPTLSSKRSPPLPSVSGTGGAPNRLQSRSEWQYMQPNTAVARYPPRATRSGVISTMSSGGGISRGRTMK